MYCQLTKEDIGEHKRMQWLIKIVLIFVQFCEMKGLEDRHLELNIWTHDKQWSAPSQASHYCKFATFRPGVPLAGVGFQSMNPVKKVTWTGSRMGHLVFELCWADMTSTSTLSFSVCISCSDELNWPNLSKTKLVPIMACLNQFTLL